MKRDLSAASFHQQQASLLRRMALAIERDHAKSMRGVLCPLLNSAAETNETVLQLSDRGNMRDAFILARVVMESLINICFIVVSGEDQAERARAHWLQRAYRSWNQTIETPEGDYQIGWAGKLDTADMERVHSAVQLFTDARGKQIRDWTPEGIRQRILAIHAKHGTSGAGSFFFSFSYLWGAASEIAHGTLFGTLYAYGMAYPPQPTSNEEVLQYRSDMLGLAQYYLGWNIDSTAHVLGTELTQPWMCESQANMHDYEKSRECRNKS